MKITASLIFGIAMLAIYLVFMARILWFIWH